MIATIGRQLKQSVNVFHSLILYRRLPTRARIHTHATTNYQYRRHLVDHHIVLARWRQFARRSATLPLLPAASADGRRQSRSAFSDALLVPWTRTSTGQHSFAAYGPRTWNRLPTALRSPELSLSSFKRQLKTHLFQQ